MAEQLVADGKVSLANDGDPSNQSGCQLSTRPGSSKRRKLDKETSQQAAASDPVKSPESGSSGRDTVDQVGEAVEVQREQVLQVAVDPNILKKLRAVMSKSCKYPLDDEGLRECIMKTSIDPMELLQFFKNVEARYENTDQGDKRVILVLMHHTRDDDFSTDIKKWSETYQNVVLDVHVLFHETLRGLLKCPRNDEAVHQIQTVLKDHSK